MTGMNPQDAARDLLARTAELPETKRELFAVLNEYRRALYDLLHSGPHGQAQTSAGARGTGQAAR